MIDHRELLLLLTQTWPIVLVVVEKNSFGSK